MPAWVERKNGGSTWLTQQAPSPEKTTSSILAMATAAFATGIFLADLFNHLAIAFAVLWVEIQGQG